MYLGNWPPKTDQLSALRPWTLAVVTSEYLDQFLAGLDGTVTIVIDKVETGLWEQTRPIVILLDSLDSVDVLLNNKYFARHANILIMAPSASPTLLQAARQDIPTHDRRVPDQLHSEQNRVAGLTYGRGNGENFSSLLMTSTIASSYRPCMI